MARMFRFKVYERGPGEPARVRVYSADGTKLGEITSNKSTDAAVLLALQGVRGCGHVGLFNMALAIDPGMEGTPARNGAESTLDSAAGGGRPLAPGSDAGVHAPAEVPVNTDRCGPGSNPGPSIRPRNNPAPPDGGSAFTDGVEWRWQWWFDVVLLSPVDEIDDAWPWPDQDEVSGWVGWRMEFDGTHKPAIGPRIAFWRAVGE